MIVDTRIREYINSLDRGNDDFLEGIRKDAVSNDVPIIRREMENFLKVVLLEKKPKKILEIGAAVGYSSLLMSQYIDSESTITTIENYDKRIPIAKKNFEDGGKSHQISLLEGDALEILKSMNYDDGPFDFVFIDAAKGQYSLYLEQIMRLLAKDAIIIADNVLQDGDIVESKYVIERRNRTIHERMREFLYYMTHNENLVTSIIPIGDGITYSIFKGIDKNE